MKPHTFSQLLRSLGTGCLCLTYLLRH